MTLRSAQKGVASIRSRALRIITVALAAAVVLATPGAARAQGIGERISAYDVTIGIQADGSMEVVERIDYYFGTTEHHGIFRDIPVRFPIDDRYDRVYPIEDISVSGSPGTPDSFSTQTEGQLLRIKIGDANKTITGAHTYTISYRVRGALEGFPDHDELYWNAIGTSWLVPIDGASVHVTIPADVTAVACFAGPNGSRLSCTDSSSQGRTATFQQDSLGPEEGLTIVVGFPTGAVPTPHPILKERWSIGRAFAVTPLTAGLSGGLLILLLLSVIVLFWSKGRDRRARSASPIDVAYGTSEAGEQTVPLFERGVTVVEFAPPDGVRAGQVGVLMDEVANPLDVSATIVDLAVRGYLRIEEIPKKGWFGKPDWSLVKLKDADTVLLPYEGLLLDGLFQDASNDDDAEDDDELGIPARPDEPARPEGLARVRLSALRRHFATRLQNVEKALYEDSVKQGWFSGRPDTVRSRWHAIGFVVFLAGDGLIWLAAAKTHLALVPIPIALAGILLLWGAGRMPRRTPKGTGLLRRIRGFRTYIETAEKEESRFAERANLFSQYLPFAIVFGCTEKWARAFSQLGDQEQLTAGGWYVGSQAFTVASFSSSIDHFAVTTSGTITSSAASGSSGLGGGGFSGGGGGGGGGGSW
jgi:hypothetical protein